MFFSCRNYFLDFDWTGLMSALEQNFNPNPLEASKREGLGKDRREGVCVK
jgi:hypothetical protein